jgi:hypothetical protein
VALGRREEQEKAAAARAEELAALRAELARLLVPRVGHLERDAEAERALELPGFVQQPAELVEARAAAEREPHLVREVAHRAQDRHALAGARALALEDVVGAALVLGVEEEHPPRELLHGLGGRGHRLDVDRAVGIEADVVHAAERRGILVLLADRLAEQVDLDAARLLGDVLGADDVALVGVEREQHADGERARRPQARAGRDVADGGDLDVAAEAGELQRLAHQLVAQLLEVVDDLRARIRDAGGGLEARADRDVHVLVERERQHRAVLAAIERRQVGAAAGEAHAIGRLRDDHAASELR